MKACWGPQSFLIAQSVPEAESPRTTGAVGRALGLEAVWPGLQYQPHTSLACCEPWASSLTFQSLSFLVCKMGARSPSEDDGENFGSLVGTVFCWRGCWFSRRAGGGCQGDVSSGALPQGWGV